MAEKVGFIGLGIMGSLQAMNLAKAGVELTVFNRTREKADEWAAEHGGTVVDSPKAVAEASDVVITMVVDGAQVEDMIGQALEGAKPGTLFIDMSTIAPGTARSLAERCSAEGHAFVDAPVTGSSPKARTGTLTIMVGGAEADIERARPLFEIMGEKIVVCGESGQGQAVKVITQAITAVNCATLAQGLVLASQAGVNMDALLETMDGGSSDSTMRALEGQADARARLHAAIQARAHAQGRPTVSRRGAHRGRLVPVRRPRRGALRGGHGPRSRGPGFRRGARGDRGPQWFTCVTTWRVCTLCPKIGRYYEKPANLQGYFVILGACA